MPEIDFLVENFGGQNKNNATIRFMNMIKEVEFFGTSTLHLYINCHANNDYYHAFNSLKVLHREQNVGTFDKCCEILNTSNNAEVIQIFHENFFDWE